MDLLILLILICIILLTFLNFIQENYYDYNSTDYNSNKNILIKKNIYEEFNVDNNIKTTPIIQTTDIVKQITTKLIKTENEKEEKNIIKKKEEKEEKNETKYIENPEKVFQSNIEGVGNIYIPKIVIKDTSKKNNENNMFKPFSNSSKKSSIDFPGVNENLQYDIHKDYYAEKYKQYYYNLNKKNSNSNEEINHNKIKYATFKKCLNKFKKDSKCQKEKNEYDNSLLKLNNKISKNLYEQTIYPLYDYVPYKLKDNQNHLKVCNSKKCLLRPHYQDKEYTMIGNEFEPILPKFNYNENN